MDLIPFGWDPFSGQGFPFQPSKMGAPKVDVQETNKEVIVVADIPGVDPKKVNVEIGSDAVKISATIEQEKESKGKNFYRKERATHSFQRVVPLPCPVNAENVKATAKNGTLTVVLPKRNPEPLKMRKIPVEEE